MKRYPVNLPDEFLDDVVRVIRANDQHAAAIYLFGSYVRGEERPESDVDIYVVTGGPHPFVPTEERKAAETEFEQLIEEYGLNPSVISFGPLRDFPERIRDVAHEERSVWLEGIPLWMSEDFQRQSQSFDDSITFENIYIEEVREAIRGAHHYWRRLNEKDERYKLREEDRPLYELAVKAQLACSVVRMICWVREIHRTPTLPKQSLSTKISRCVEEGWIAEPPDEVNDSLAVLAQFLRDEEGNVPVRDNPQAAPSIEEVVACSDEVAEFLRENGYPVPRPGDRFR